MPDVTIHAFMVSPGRNGADCTCYPFKAGDEAGQQSAFDSARDHISEAAENVELNGEASIELREVEPDECLDCQCDDDDCDCRQASGNPEFKPEWDKEDKPS
jgi:hypothetical protein